mgnify:CR=1 FL=1
MFNIIVLHQVQALLIAAVSYVLIREFIIRRMNKTPKKIVVGIIDNDEVSDLLITDYLDCENRQNDLHSMKATKFNYENELLKADRAYSAIARSIQADLDKVL